MSRISDIFDGLKVEGSMAFMPYITAGYPSLEATAELIQGLDKAGVDIIEIGFPFSDPLADGPTIQMSSQKALDAGASPKKIIEMVGEVRDSVNCALVAMTYVNPVHSAGYDKFAASVASAGFDGVIVPDLPPEEGEELFGECAKQGMDRILLVAPTSSDKRIELAAEHGSGFMYCVSLAGVTGARASLSNDVAPFLERVRGLCSLPLALGFGVSTPEHVREVAGLADGVIVGSAIIDVIHKNADEDIQKLVQETTAFTKPLIDAAKSFGK